MGDIWQIRCYLDLDGVDVIDEWLNDQPDRIQARFDQRIRHLRQQPKDKWVRPYFDTLSDDCSGLGEVRFECGNVQYRPIGFASGKMEFTLIFVAREIGGEFIPRNTCKKSQERKTEVQADRRRSHVCDFE